MQSVAPCRLKPGPRLPAANWYTAGVTSAAPPWPELVSWLLSVAFILNYLMEFFLLRDFYKVIRMLIMIIIGFILRINFRLMEI